MCEIGDAYTVYRRHVDPVRILVIVVEIRIVPRLKGQGVTGRWGGRAIRVRPGPRACSLCSVLRGTPFAGNGPPEPPARFN